MLEKFYNSLSSNTISQITVSVVLFFVFTLIKKILKRIVTNRAELHQFDKSRIMHIRSTVSIAVWSVFLIILSIIWNLSLEGLSIYVASIFTVVGVGLFASWSMISNITASVILFFFFPIKVGSKVKIVDGDNSAVGIILGVSLFSIQILHESGHVIYYPNNLALQKSIVHLDEIKEDKDEI